MLAHRHYSEKRRSGLDLLGLRPTGMQITADHLQLQSVVLFKCTKKYQWLKNRIISCFFFSIRNDYPDVTVLVMSFIIRCVAY